VEIELSSLGLALIDLGQVISKNKKIIKFMSLFAETQKMSILIKKQHLDDGRSGNNI